MKRIPIKTREITLGQFLKWAGAAETGGRARMIIADGAVRVNGRREWRAGRRLVWGDQVSVEEQVYLVVGDDGGA